MNLCYHFPRFLALSCHRYLITREPLHNSYWTNIYTVMLPFSQFFLTLTVTRARLKILCWHKLFDIPFVTWLSWESRDQRRCLQRNPTPSLILCHHVAELPLSLILPKAVPNKSNKQELWGGTWAWKFWLACNCNPSLDIDRKNNYLGKVFYSP